MSFLECLKVGQKYEKIASNLLKENHNIETVSFNFNHNYDFIDTNDIKYEVKYDRRSSATGNFFVEYSSRDKPSGIFNTESHKYIFMVNEIDGYMLDVKDLKQMIEDKTYKKDLKCYLEGKKVGGYLFDTNYIILNSMKI